MILGALPLAVDYVNSREDLLPGKILDYIPVNIGSGDDESIISANSIKYDKNENIGKIENITFLGFLQILYFPFDQKYDLFNDERRRSRVYWTR